MSGLDEFLSAARFGQRKHGIDYGAQFSRVDQLRNRIQGLGLHFIHNHGCPNAVFLRFRLRRGLCDGNQNSAALQDLPRARLRVAALRIEDCIHVAHDVFKTDRCIIDSFVGPQLFEISLIALRGRSDDMDPFGMRKLNGESAHTPCRAVDKYLLARF